MTHVGGQAFQAMAIFTTSSNTDARHHLMHTMSVVALEFVGLAIGSLALSSLMSTLWLWVGERIVKRLRHEVFLAVTSREIEWFDMLGENKEDGDEESASGAGSLMAKFARYVRSSNIETMFAQALTPHNCSNIMQRHRRRPDLRIAVSLNMGMLVEYTAAFFTALILALAQSWSLT